MGKKYLELSERHIQFISDQKIFFVGTATADSRVNISPKGMDSFRVLDSHTVAWLNLTGSGNETSAHIQINPRMTIMFAAFEGPPMILRLYGQANVIHHRDSEWDELFELFPSSLGARQIFRMSVELVQSSCGMAVPFYEYVSEREQLNVWAKKKGVTGIRNYWEQKNQLSIDGIPTNIVEKNAYSTKNVSENLKNENTRGKI